MNIDWDKLRIFHAVADAGSLTHSGATLNISQSAASRQISGLEKSLGVRLFHRHARGLVLTSEGELLYKTSRSVYAQLSAAISEIMESHQGMRGYFKIATTVAFGSIWLAPRLKQFLSPYPDLNVTLHLTDEEVDFVMGEADVAVRMSKGSVDPDLCYEKIFDFELRIYGNKEYLQAYGMPQSFEDLDRHHLLVFGTQSAAPVANVNWLLRVGCKPGVVREPYLVMNNAYGLLQSVHSGLGLALLPSFAKGGDAQLVDIFPSYQYPLNEAYLVYPKRLEQSSRIKSFRSFVIEQMKGK